MSNDVAGPGDLEPLKEPLIESVINAYMAKAVPSGEMEFSHGSCKEGEFRYKDDRWGKDTKIYCYYPSGNWKVDQWLDPDDDLGNDEAVGEIQTFDAAAAFAEIRESVSGWIDPWIACGDPARLTDQIQTLADIVDLLYVQDEVRLGGESISSGADEGSTSIPVTDVQSAIADTRSTLSSLNGLAIDALEAAYVNDVGLTISGQRAMAGVAALAVGGEAEAWSRAFADLRDFFTQATADFNSFARSREGSGERGSTTLSIVSGVATAAAGASFAFPPAAGALGVVAGLAGIGAAMWPSEAAVEATIVALEGSDFDSLWTSFGEAVWDINSEIVDAEHSLAMMCRNVIADFGSHPDAFSITSRGRADIPQAGDNLPRFLDTDQNSAPIELYAGDNVNVVHSKLEAVAGFIDHIGDHQRSVAGKVDPVASSGSGDWERQYLQGGIIGWGPTGHYYDTKALLDELVDLLLLEAGTAQRIAGHCVDISTDFRLTEDEITTRVNELESELG